MFCKYCGNKIDDEALFCSACGKSQYEKANQQDYTIKKKSDNRVLKGLVIAALALGIVGLIAWLIPLIGYNNQLWFQQENNQDDLDSENIDSDNAMSDNSDIAKSIKTEKESKIYKVVSNKRVSKSDMNNIVYYLQKRADDYSADAVVLMKKEKSDWYIEISMPGIEEEVYDKLVKKTDLKFIGNIDSDNEEIIVTDKNIKSAKALTNEDSVTGKKEYVVEISFDDEGTEAFDRGTKKYFDDIIYILLDGEIISAPRVTTPITDGIAYITGMESYEDALGLATLLSVGKNEFKLEEIKCF